METRRALGKRTADNDETRLRLHVLPRLGESPLDAVRPRDLIELVNELRMAKTEEGEPKLAPKTIRNIFAVVRTMYRDAKLDELVQSNPCEGVSRACLPPAQDKDPEWRVTVIFTRDELQRLISDERIPLDRRVLYALEGVAALRHGEAAGLRWRHYDPSAEPLGKLTIATSYDTGRTKTERVRFMPVHPTLAALLAEWKLRGWPEAFGRQPGPDDLIVPLTPEPRRGRPNPRAGGIRTRGDSWHRLRRDLKALGLPPPGPRPSLDVHNPGRG